MSNLIETNAAILRELYAAIKATFKKRQEGPQQMQAWDEACRTFHDSYNRLAFPGGLDKAMSALNAGHSGTVERAVRFLEADPWFFRSGYIKADLIRHLCRAELSDDQRSRLRQVILARIQGPGRREFRSYCRLARVVSDPSFERQVSGLAASRVPNVSRHAEWVLTQLHRAAHGRLGKPI